MVRLGAIAAGAFMGLITGCAGAAFLSAPVQLAPGKIART